MIIGRKSTHIFWVKKKQNETDASIILYFPESIQIIPKKTSCHFEDVQSDQNDCFRSMREQMATSRNYLVKYCLVTS